MFESEKCTELLETTEIIHLKEMSRIVKTVLKWFYVKILRRAQSKLNALCYRKSFGKLFQ